MRHARKLYLIAALAVLAPLTMAWVILVNNFFGLALDPVTFSAPGDQKVPVYQSASKQWTVATVPYVAPPDASTSTKGITKLSAAPLLASNPIAVGDRDTRMLPAPGAGAAAVRLAVDNNAAWGESPSGTVQYQLPQIGAGATALTWGLIGDNNVTPNALTAASLAAAVTNRLNPAPGAAASAFRLVYDTNSAYTAMSSSSAAYQVPSVNSGQTAVIWGLLTGNSIATATIADANMVANTLTTASMASSVTNRLNATPAAGAAAVRLAVDNNAAWGESPSGTVQYQTPQIGAGATALTWALINDNNITAASLTTASFAASVTNRLMVTPATVGRISVDGGSGAAAVALAQGSAGDLFLSQGAAANPSFTTMSGDATITSAGVLTIGSAKISLAKMANLAASTLIGRDSSGSGVPQALTMGTGLSITAGVINAATGTIAIKSGSTTIDTAMTTFTADGTNFSVTNTGTGLDTLAIATNGVGTSNIAANAVTSAKILDGTIVDADHAANTLTTASMASSVTNRLLPASQTAGCLVYSDGTAGQITAQGTAGQYAKSNGASAPGWDNPSPVGSISQYAGRTAPTNWLLCDGSAVSRTTYAGLYAVLVVSKGTTTMTIASPCVVTFTAHGLTSGEIVFFETSGALPTGVSADTSYFITKIDANTFKLSTTWANFIAGTFVNTSGTQSGTHTLFDAPWGVAGSSTTFNVPDFRGRTAFGWDSADGGGRLTRSATGGIDAAGVGTQGGEQAHTLSSAEMPSHSHNGTSGLNFYYSGGGNNPSGSGGATSQQAASTATAGSGGAHNVTPPGLVINFIIKY